MDICEFQASLVYRVSSRPVRATSKNPVFKKNKKTKKKQKKPSQLKKSQMGQNRRIAVKPAWATQWDPVFKTQNI